MGHEDERGRQGAGPGLTVQTGEEEGVTERSEAGKEVEN